MIQSLLFLITSLTVFLILTEILTVNVFYGETTVIDINLTVFGIRLTESSDPINGKKKQRKKSKVGAIKDFVIAASEKSEITVRYINFSMPKDEPAQVAIKQGIYISLLSSLLAYAENKAKNLYIGNITFDNSANNNLKISFDISFKISLIALLSSLCTYAKRRNRKV